jgi:hypothetical protein
MLMPPCSVNLDALGLFQWINDPMEIIHKKEPQTSGWDRFVAGFFRMLPIRSQL